MAIEHALIGVALIELGIIVYLYWSNKKQKQVTKQLKMKEERYRIACDLSNDILFEYDIRKDCIQFAEEYVESFGRPSVQENYSNSIAYCEWVENKDLSIYRELIASLKRGKPYIETELRMRNAMGEFVWCQIQGKTIFGTNSIPIKIIGKILNIDTQKKELSLLQEKSRIDPLTNAYNKCVTKDLIEQKLVESNLEEAHALMIIDIDDFKSINDTYGHILGDKVLVQIISHIRRMFCDEDIVGRIGGDEFVVFMNHINSKEEIVAKTLKLFTAFKNRYEYEDTEFKVTGSVGISMYPRDGRSYDELLEKADKALYEVKARGKNNFNLYSSKEELVDARF
ncbi:MAG: diguanylate cyclase domain-containing protein [Velocimicrobium sp.]